MLFDLDHHLRIGHLARHLADVPNLHDPHARRRRIFVRTGLVASARDSHAAGELAAKRRVAFSDPVPAPEPAPDDLVERVAEGLAWAARLGEVDLGDERSIVGWIAGAGCYGRNPTRPEVIEPATERARSKLAAMRVREGGRRLPRLLDRAADTLALVLLVTSWAAVYCVLCPPASAATGERILTDERVYTALSLGPVAVFVAVIVVIAWCNRGVRAVADDEPRYDVDVSSIAAPPIAPDLEALRRRADRA